MRLFLAVCVGFAGLICLCFSIDSFHLATASASPAIASGSEKWLAGAFTYAVALLLAGNSDGMSNVIRKGLALSLLLPALMSVGVAAAAYHSSAVALDPTFTMLKALVCSLQAVALASCAFIVWNRASTINPAAPR